MSNDSHEEWKSTLDRLLVELTAGTGLDAKVRDGHRFTVKPDGGVRIDFGIVCGSWTRQWLEFGDPAGKVDAETAALLKNDIGRVRRIVSRKLRELADRMEPK